MRLGGDETFDLAELDTQSSELDLVIQSAQDINVAVLVPLGVIARAVHTLSVVVYECFGSFFGKIAVAARDSDTADIQLADHTVGRGIAELVNDYLVVVKQRPADGHIIGVCQISRVAGDGDLRRSVGVDNADRVGARCYAVSE